MSALITSFSFSRADLRDQSLGGGPLLESISLCHLMLTQQSAGGNGALIETISVNHLVEQEPAAADVSKILISGMSFSKAEQDKDLTTRKAVTI